MPSVVLTTERFPAETSGCPSALFPFLRDSDAAGSDNNEGASFLSGPERAGSESEHRGSMTGSKMRHISDGAVFLRTMRERKTVFCFIRQYGRETVRQRTL